MTLAIFWISVAAIFYTYAGYPMLMYVLARARPRMVRKSEESPGVTVIIAAYNEQKNILAKLENVLASDYPGDKLSIVVGSDASTDDTDRIVEGYAGDRVVLLRVDGRLGKTHVQNRAVAIAKGEVLVFTDATTFLKPDAIRNLVRSFADNDVAAVGGRLVYQESPESHTGRGGVSYWNYETMLRIWESEYRTMIGVSGCFYAVRKSEYKDIPDHLISDFIVALDLAGRKKRVVLEPDAICFEDTLDGTKDELQMRVRVILRSLVAIKSRAALLNPFRHGVVSLSLWSHKLMRYLMPVFFAALILSLPFLAGSLFFLVILILTAIGLGMAVMGVLGKSTFKPVVMCSYLLLTNLASLIAFWQFIRGQNVVVWTPKR